MCIDEEVRRWFRKCRREKKLSRSAMAEKMEVSTATLERFENGRGLMNWGLVEKGFDLLGYEPVFSIRMKEKSSNQ